MATNTTRLALRKPDGTPITGDAVDVSLDLNANWDKVDAAVGAVACTSGARPGSPYNGQMARETDTGNLILWNGSAWKRVFMESDGDFPDGFRAVLGTTGTTFIAGYVTADTQDRIKIFGSGEILWGSGAIAGDTNLKRDSANVLRTNDSLTVDIDLSVGGNANVTGDVNVTGKVVPGVGFFFKERVIYANAAASGNFTKASYTGIRGVITKVWGSGGGSGGRAATSSSQVAAAGGGGGGGYAEKWIAAASLASSETVTVGAGGSAGASGANAGGAGATSSFGSHASATGGGGGAGGTAQTNTAFVALAGGAGGTGTASGGFVSTGSDGGYGLCISGLHLGGAGGSAAGMAGFKEAVGAAGGGGSGGAGYSPGGGASGANATVSNGAVAGAAGADGMIIVDVYV